MVTSKVIGFAGRIWIMWDSSILGMILLSCNHQSIIDIVNGGRQVDWLFTTVYASPKRMLQDKLWAYLKGIGQHILFP